ncbi:exported hypothetical protein [Candidatus Nitrospira nitrosa]|uniref:VPLPA-CTERM protein sorting domain-containing protein n=1 Tax=Candidatus Nitrospira nitrosa TaxID=1742972 RepID=A0A0S4L9U3_9BACT|nr:VPLPA-CTERM sorting domain-containing protein [Candidatus Nitrospira nitrosa]CUS34277.1 exported hypothetical protein [Candidatus Nitrospira nitrosa]
MKHFVSSKQSLGLIAAAVGLWLGGVAPSYAATVTAGDSVTGGIGYQWTVNMSGYDTTAGSTPNYAGTVGSLSWSDPINAGDPIGTGWTHTSNWTALTLTEAADLTITLAANGSTLVPAFTLWSGHQQTDNGTPGGYHTYNNAGNFDWSTQGAGYDSSSLNYIGNATASGTDSSITRTFSLGPGLYSLVFGGNPPAGTPGSAVAYQATLSTVPVPAAVWLFGSGLIGLAGLARRKFSA